MCNFQKRMLSAVPELTGLTILKTGGKCSKNLREKKIEKTLPPQQGVSPTVLQQFTSSRTQGDVIVWL